MMATYAKAQVKREARLARIREMAGKMPAHAIADALHMSPESLNWQCWRNGISLAYQYKVITPEQRRYIMEAREAGVPYAEIAEKTGRTIPQVCTIVSNTKNRGVQWK
ncbi:hypothetical protein [Pantoea piersonii]|jgi:DNA-directed RNA polymerase specialized sigma24 family protein|uniref:hypothetical protein n=1 Tax=Pantoea piersonii TaxID=2364647 RepID=UPI000EA02508|nr:hypothetical protein [Pantoea piersonii]MBZ6385094.1 hypothetical protein [Pantoea piersonii]MBZ6385170.1 hypothetical protein [Pantoea piersonii]MBZ6398622.1 hypothetical protein [Pantoea piersonii]MBZ6398698.1 hypothetical protein [Pantoea piersonii]MBZ6406552.1 hypothetical protein [Pantoea piersonii]